MCMQSMALPFQRNQDDHLTGTESKRKQQRWRRAKAYLKFVLEQLELDEISYKTMMGEYIIYYRGKVVGGIYDDRFLVKPVKSAVAMMPNAERELPYEGAKEMLLVENVENREFLARAAGGDVR